MYAIIVAGGQGRRMGNKIPKQFLLINRKPIIFHTIERFVKAIPEIKIIVVLHPDYISYWQDLIKKYSFNFNGIVCAGGQERFYSVKNGLNLLQNTGSDTIVGIHDAVRPLVSIDVIQKAYYTAKTKKAVIPIVSANETVRIIKDDGGSYTFDRNKVKLVQTPQVFSLQLLQEAYSQHYKNDFTDDASVVEALEHKITLIEGNKENIKITTPTDMLFAEIMLRDKAES